jgi:putative glutamine amidotransferase
MARPRIGICVAQEQARWTVWDQQAFLLPASYVARVRNAGGRAILLPPDPHDVEHPGDALEGIDGLLLIGGTDIDPATYGAAPHPATDDPQPERDRFEIALTRAALERDLPVLGICRGMQLIDVACGGTLIQHLPDDVGHGDHRRSLGSFDDADHDVRLTEGSLAARAAGEALHATKSHHHQGVATVGEGLVATGWSVLDDLVEAVEAPDRRYALGVQWHPEADAKSTIVASLVAAAGEGAGTAARRRPARRRAAA